MSLFHKNLHFLRKLKMLSQTEIANIFETTQNTWSKWEKGREPDYDILLKMSKYFEVSIDDMIGVDIARDGLSKKNKAPSMPELHSLIVEKELALRSEQALRRDAYEKIKAAIGAVLELEQIRDKAEWKTAFEKLKKGIEKLNE